MGLLSGIKEGFTKLNTGTPERPSFFDRLSTFGARLQDIDDGGDRVASLEQRRKATLLEQQAAQERQQMAAMADQLGLSPKEKFLLMANPQVYGQLLKEQLAPTTLSRGQQRIGPDGAVISEVPTYEQFGDQYMRIDSQGVAPTYQRPKTYEEMQRETQAALNNDFERQRIGIARQNAGTSAGQLVVSQGRLAFDRQRGGTTGAGGAKPWERNW